LKRLSEKGPVQVINEVAGIYYLAGEVINPRERGFDPPKHFNPFLQTKVFISSSALVSQKMALRSCRLLGASPTKRQRTQTRQPSFLASPKVWTGNITLPIPTR